MSSNVTFTVKLSLTQQLTLIFLLSCVFLALCLVSVIFIPFLGHCVSLVHWATLIGKQDILNTSWNFEADVMRTTLLLYNGTYCCDQRITGQTQCVSFCHPQLVLEVGNL